MASRQEANPRRFMASAQARPYRSTRSRVTTSHDGGTRVDTDMPRELGGSGERVSPGWLFRPDERFNGRQLLRGEAGATP